MSITELELCVCVGGFVWEGLVCDNDEAVRTPTTLRLV
jgi:hypothetical protein